MSDLRETLSMGEISDKLEDRVAGMGLADGVHTVSINSLGAVLSEDEKDTIGGLTVDVNVTVSIKGGSVEVLGGTWQQSSPDIYDFSPLWSSHRTLKGNVATVAEHVFSTVFLPKTNPQPYKVGIIGVGNIAVEEPPKCFASGTIILSPFGEKYIQDISVNDSVFVYDSSEICGRAGLKVGYVSKTYQNVSREFIRVEWYDSQHRQSLIVTPGHLFLDETGGFTKIGDLLRLGGGKARLIDEHGQVVTATGEWIYFSEETADMFERASTRSMTVAGNTVFKEDVQEGWRTYNFEVEGLHTYIAGGIRVHNDSGPLGNLANQIDKDLDRSLGIQPGSIMDKVTDLITAPLHAAGQLLEAAEAAAAHVVRGFTTAREMASRGDYAGAAGAFVGGVLDGLAEMAGGLVRAAGELIGGVFDVVRAVGDSIADAIDGHYGRDGDHDGVGHDGAYPVIIDLDSDGVEIDLNRHASFDMDGDGYQEQTAWAAKDDGFLVIDLDKDGGFKGAADDKLSFARELILTEIVGLRNITDLQALSMIEKLHGNGDGVLNSKDALWQRLKIWQDANQNGVVDNYNDPKLDEMKTLDAFGIKQINLRYDNGKAYTDAKDDVSIFGNTLKGSASYVKTDGTVVKGGVGDVSLSYNAQGWRRNETAVGYEIQFEVGGKLAIAELEGKLSS